MKSETSDWRLLDLEYSDAPSNLALEEAIARKIGEGKSPPTLRLWRNRNAAVIGENQSAAAELQLDTCKELGVEVVRRFTGGGAVYHDLGNLNYSICTRKLPLLSSELRQSIFRLSLDCTIACLEILGVESNRIPINTVVVRGKKISGGAGAVRWGSIFYHGSILVSTHLETIWRILRWVQPLTPRKFVQSKRLQVTSVKAELCKETSVEEVQEALKDAFTRTFRAHLVHGAATEEELGMVSALVREKYSTDEWNLKM